MVLCIYITAGKKFRSFNQYSCWYALLLQEGRTAVHYAALNNHPEVVQLLANNSADLNSQDKVGIYQ